MALNTPTFDIAPPGNIPNKTGVFTVLSIVSRFCPGCAIKVNWPVPAESYEISNCQRLLSFAVNALKTVMPNVKPEPVPPIEDGAALKTSVERYPVPERTITTEVTLFPVTEIFAVAPVPYIRMHDITKSFVA